MKFTFFHLMPFDGLPEDFRDRYRSVWVDIPPHLQDRHRIHRLYNTYLDDLEYAAAQGFDAIGVNEHHSNAYGLMSSPNMMAASLARRTAATSAKLLVMGDAVPLYSPPIRIAEELAMLDVLSGGRLITGFPLGSSQDANFAYGVRPVDIRERHREGFELVMRAWTEPEVFAFNGRYTKLRYVNPWPKPLQDPHPPVWIPGSGSVESMEFAIELDLPYFLLSYFGADFATNLFEQYWARVAAQGRDASRYRAGMFQIVLVADTDEEARRLFAPHVDYFFKRCTHIYPGFVEAPGYKTVKSLETLLPPPGTKSAKRPDSFVAAQGYSWDDMVEKGIVIGGSPDTVRERLAAAAAKNNIGNWVVLGHVGSMPSELVRHSIELFTRKVAPALADPEIPHPWWPKEIAGFSPTLPGAVAEPVGAA